MTQRSTQAMTRLRTILTLAGVALVAAPAAASYTWRQHGQELEPEQVVQVETAFELLETAAPQSEVRRTIVVKEDQREIRIELRDGKVKAWVDGDTVDSSNIKNNGGVITIHGENGELLHTVQADVQMVVEAPRPAGTWNVRRGGEEFAIIERQADGGGAIQVVAGAPPVMIGINHSAVGEALRHHLDLPEKAIIIERVIDGLPAGKAGLQRYDIVVSVDGRGGIDATGLGEALRTKAPGDTLQVEVVRGGATKTIEIKLEAYDAGSLNRFPAAVTGVPMPPQPTPPPTVIGQRLSGEAIAEREIMQLRELLAQSGETLRGLRFQLDGDRLVLPDAKAYEEQIMLLEQKLAEMQPELEDELEDRLEAFEDRMNELEERLEDSLDRLFDRLERTLERLERDS